MRAVRPLLDAAPRARSATKRSRYPSIRCSRKRSRSHGRTVRPAPLEPHRTHRQRPGCVRPVAPSSSSEVHVAVPSFLARERIVARPGFNRWLIPPAALAVHLCIGQAYATSVYKAALVTHFDASLTAIGLIFSIAIVMLGLSAAVFGTWVDRNGPRAAMFTSACFWVTGFLVGSLGIATEQLWLLYLGYGVIGGIGLGIGYISPVSTLIKWFPDRPGLATGMVIMGFGGGALIASPLSKQLMSWYDSDYDPATAGSLPDGSAVSLLFLTLGLVYLVFMLFGAALIRAPADGSRPAGFDPSTVRQKVLVTTESVSARNAIRTPQFWLL